MLSVHDRNYPLPVRPVAVVCLDGSDPSYVDDAIEADLAPTLARWRREGTAVIAEAAFPTFTNPNNLCIVSGAPPSVHGICGNFHLDPETGEERPLSRAADVRGGDNILVALVRAGVPVAAVTAKKKLLAMLALPEPGRAYSAEDAAAEACALAGRAAPDVYSADASYFVLDVGLALLAGGHSRVVYLSTTDYVQHKHAPGTPEARAFYAGIDARLAALEALGAVVVLTADHGMNAKTRADGSPAVTYLEPRLDPRARVILPITDPYVAHHGALGGMALVYGMGAELHAARAALVAAPGVERVLSRAEAAAEFQLPPDRLGDLVVLADAHTVLGKRPEAHDLTAVARGLRSHGSTHERAVPLTCNLAGAQLLGPSPRNADAFALALGLAAG